MRARLQNAVLCTVQPIVEVQGDVFGDRSPITAANRTSTIQDVPIQVTFLTGTRSGEGDPGRAQDIQALGLVLKRDAERLGWTPKEYDLIQLPEGGDSLFVVDIQPAYPARRSLGRPSGGYDGWRLKLTDKNPTLAAATTYE